MPGEPKQKRVGPPFLCYHPESDSLFLSNVFETDGLVEDVTGIPLFEERFARENPNVRSK